MSARDPPDLIDGLIADWKRERPRSEPDAMGVVGRIIRLGHRYQEEAARLLRPLGLSYSDFDVLATLRRSGPPFDLTPTDLQRNVLLSSGAMTACLRRLEQAGLIERAAGKADRRSLSARLTASGHVLVESLIDQRFAIARDALGSLEPEEARALKGLLRRLGS